MTCQEVKNLTPDYLAGAIDATAMRSIHMHMTDCSECRAELEGLSETWTRLGVLEDEQPSANLRGGFYKMLETYQDGLAQSHNQPGFWERLRQWSWQPALALGGVLSIALAAFWAGFWLQQPKNPGSGQDMLRLTNEVNAMRQQVSLSLLNQSFAGDRLKGVALTSQIKNPEPTLLDALLNTVDNDPSINVRLSAVDALYLFAQSPNIRASLTRSLGKQTSPVIQIALIDLLVSLREKQAATALKQLIGNQTVRPEVRQRAQSGIAQLL